MGVEVGRQDRIKAPLLRGYFPIFHLPNFDTSSYHDFAFDQLSILANFQAEIIAKQLHTLFKNKTPRPNSEVFVTKHSVKPVGEPELTRTFVRVEATTNGHTDIWTAKYQRQGEQIPQLLDFSIYQEHTQAQAAIVSMSLTPTHVVQDVRLRSPQHGTLRAFVYSNNQNPDGTAAGPIGSNYRVQYHQRDSKEAAKMVQLPPIHTGDTSLPGISEGGINIGWYTLAAEPEFIAGVRLDQAGYTGFYILLQAQVQINALNQQLHG